MTTSLISDDWRVSGAVYRDPTLFETEIEEIFGRCWLYVAHETELPHGGDFKLAQLGRQPVIAVRGADDGVIRVVFNRCRHRAAAVCQQEAGTTTTFRCAYHGWAYRTDGGLVNATLAEAYGPEFDKDAMGLVPVPRVATYRGFVFASLDPAAPGLEAYLGNARRYLDYVADLGVELTAGAQKIVYRGNWKLQVENTIDAYHFAFTHKSWLDVLKRRAGGESNAFLENAISNPTWRTLDLRGGHAAAEMGPLGSPTDERPDMGLGDLVPFNLVVFPSLGFVGSHLRLIRPVGVDETEVQLFPMLPVGADEAARAEVLRAHEAFYGPSGAGSADDVEVGFDRVTDGLRATATPEDWLLLSRGLDREEEDPATGIRVGRPADEVPQRAFYRRWLELVQADVLA